MSMEGTVWALAFTATLAFGFGMVVNEIMSTKAAIQHGAAHFDRVTGVFTWNDVTPEEKKP